MKSLLVSALLTMAIGSLEMAVHARVSVAEPTPPVSTQSAPLVTQPASIDRLPNRSSSRTTPYTADQLNSILGNLQANPKPATPAPKGSIESLIQRFSPPDRKPTAIDPIDFFKPPALDGGVKIPIQ